MNIYVATWRKFNVAVWAHSQEEAASILEQTRESIDPALEPAVITEEHISQGRLLEYVPIFPTLCHNPEVYRLLGAEKPNELQCDVCGFFPFGLEAYAVCPECRCCRSCKCYCKTDD